MGWTKTALGPVQHWPESLRSAVSILLPSRAQIVLFWGPELVTIYNDAYRPVFGVKHPRVLGLPARQAWSEIWENGLRQLHDGPSAIDAFAASRPDAVLLDIGMPGMDGYEVARTLRARFADHRATLVALTGWGQEDDRRQAREAGFDHHLVKPAEFEALQALLAGIERRSDPV
jgi:CheY-like chemotaxis protein